MGSIFSFISEAGLLLPAPPSVSSRTSKFLETFESALHILLCRLF